MSYEIDRSTTPVKDGDGRVVQIKLNFEHTKFKMRHLVDLEKRTEMWQVIEWLVKYCGADEEELLDLDPEAFIDVAKQVKRAIFKSKSPPNGRG